MQRGGQIGSGMNEQRGRGATQAEKQTQAAVQGMLLRENQALAEADQCAAFGHSVSALLYSFYSQHFPSGNKKCH